MTSSYPNFSLPGSEEPFFSLHCFPVRKEDWSKATTQVPPSYDIPSVTFDFILFCLRSKM